MLYGLFSFFLLHKFLLSNNGNIEHSEVAKQQYLTYSELRQLEWGTVTRMKLYVSLLANTGVKKASKFCMFFIKPTHFTSFSKFGIRISNVSAVKKYLLTDFFFFCIIYKLFVTFLSIFVLTLQIKINCVTHHFDGYWIDYFLE